MGALNYGSKKHVLSALKKCVVSALIWCFLSRSRWVVYRSLEAFKARNNNKNRQLFSPWGEGLSSTVLIFKKSGTLLL